MKPKVKTIDKVIQERQWKTWLLNERDEKHHRDRERGRYVGNYSRETGERVKRVNHDRS